MTQKERNHRIQRLVSLEMAARQGKCEVARINDEEWIFAFVGRQDADGVLQPEGVLAGSHGTMTAEAHYLRTLEESDG